MLMRTYTRRSLKDRLADRTIVLATGCWEYTGYIKDNGYGVLSTGKDTYIYTHRLAWELSNGDIPEGMYILHSCDNRKCCKPQHLRIGSHLENINEMWSKGRGIRGEAVGSAVLTEEKVRDIRSRYARGEKGRALAREYGIGQATVSQIVNRNTWKHVE